EDMASFAEDVARLLGAEATLVSRKPTLPGQSTHEAGGARMGMDPGSSVLNPWGRCWEVDNLWIGDGAAFPSGGFQNPALTMMAVAGRAAEDVVRRTAHPAR